MVGHNIWHGVISSVLVDCGGKENPTLSWRLFLFDNGFILWSNEHTKTSNALTLPFYRLYIYINVKHNLMLINILIYISTKTRKDYAFSKLFLTLWIAKSGPWRYLFLVKFALYHNVYLLPGVWIYLNWKFPQMWRTQKSTWVSVYVSDYTNPAPQVPTKIRLTQLQVTKKLKF